MNGNPVLDGSIRGIIAGALTSVLMFLQVEFNVISDQGALQLAGLITALAFFLGGIYDRYGRPKT